MKALFTVLICLYFIGEVKAAPSFLALCHKDWNCNATISLYNGQETIYSGWLENTFGQQCKCADRLLSDARPKVIRAHLINSPCMRNKRCGRYEVLYKETTASASRKVIRNDKRFFKKFDQVVTTFKNRLDKASGNVRCYVSPCLECDLYERARRILINRVSNTLPNCSVVDNPYRQRCIGGTICEKHGTNPSLNRPCIVDLDGIDGQTVNLRRYVALYKHCDLTYYWESWMNCIRGDFVEPRQRNCKYHRSIFEFTRGILCQYFSDQFLDTCSP